MRKLSYTSVNWSLNVLCGLSQRDQQRTILLKAISRADVLNLTSVETGHNHPKLYRKLLPRCIEHNRPTRHNLLPHRNPRITRPSVKPFGAVRLRLGHGPVHEP